MNITVFSFEGREMLNKTWARNPKFCKNNLLKSSRSRFQSIFRSDEVYQIQAVAKNIKTPRKIKYQKSAVILYLPNIIL